MYLDVDILCDRVLRGLYFIITPNRDVPSPLTKKINVRTPGLFFSDIGVGNPKQTNKNKRVNKTKPNQNQPLYSHIVPDIFYTILEIDNLKVENPKLVTKIRRIRTRSTPSLQLLS